MYSLVSLLWDRVLFCTYIISHWRNKTFCMQTVFLVYVRKPLKELLIIYATAYLENSTETVYMNHLVMVGWPSISTEF